MTRQQQIGYALVLVGVLTGITWAVSQFIQPILPANVNNLLVLRFAALLAVLGGLAAFKDTIELIHILSGRNQNSTEQNQPVLETHFNRRVNANVIVTGGQNVTVNTVPKQEPINNRIAYAGSNQEQVELFQKLMGENVRQSLFWKERLEAYSKTWRALQVVRVAGDALWESASPENILTFANALQFAKIRVNDDAIFFENGDYHELLNLLKIFGNFYVGKQRLIRIRTRADLDRARSSPPIRRMQRQINENRETKVKYESLLDQIMESFRVRLSR